MKTLILVFTLFAFNSIFAQVGIGTETPKATLDVKGMPEDLLLADGIIVPRLTGDQIQAKDLIYTGDQTGAMIYATSGVAVPAGTKTANITQAGYYYFDGSSWVRFGNEIKFFYMPSIAIPTSSSQFVPGDGFTKTGDVFSVSLYERYRTQFATPAAKNTNFTTILPVMPANKLDYYITSYDVAVFKNVGVSNDGVLSYSIEPGAQVTAATFINIVFAIKQ